MEAITNIPKDNFEVIFASLTEDEKKTVFATCEWTGNFTPFFLKSQLQTFSKSYVSGLIDSLTDKEIYQKVDAHNYKVSEKYRSKLKQKRNESNK